MVFANKVNLWGGLWLVNNSHRAIVFGRKQKMYTAGYLYIIKRLVV